MKTILRLKQGVLVLVATVAMTSCLKSEDEGFAFTSYGSFVYQDTRKIEGTEITYEKTYLPFIQFLANQSLTAYSCTGPNGILQMERMANFPSGIQTAITSMNYSEAYPSGSYTMKATNDSQEAISFPFSISDTKPLGYINVSTLEYSSTSKEITAKWDDVENADVYSVCIGKTSEIYSVYYAKTYEKGEYKQENGVKISLTTSDLEKLTGGSFQLFIRAMVLNSSKQWAIISDSERKMPITL